jgi:2-haloacid dehalogenase
MSSLPILVFDVNETLLDLEALSPLFHRIFGDERVMREWFAQVILYSQSLTLSGDYANFGEIGAAVLQMLGETKSLTIRHHDTLELKSAMEKMPPHADVPEALDRLKQARFRMVTLTNNARATAIAQLEHAGLRAAFERTFSVDDAVHRYKPARECYEAVAEALAAPISQCLLIACHTWDTLGAASAGMQSALVLRAGNAPLKVGRQPKFVGSNLTAVADWLIDTHAAGE